MQDTHILAPVFAPHGTLVHQTLWPQTVLAAHNTLTTEPREVQESMHAGELASSTQLTQGVSDALYVAVVGRRPTHRKNPHSHAATLWKNPRVLC